MQALARTLHIGQHATFNADVTFKDLTNVPLVTGLFSCKWKFKNAAPAPQTDGSLHVPFSGPSSMLHPRSALLPPHHRRAGTPDSDDDGVHRYPEELHHISSTDRSPSAATARPPGRPPKPESHGMTDWETLKKHTVDWHDRRICCPVSIPVARTGELGSCPLRITVKTTFHNETGKIEETRLGDLHVDLAEFATVPGPTTRRFLLANSKTNALLRLTITLHHIGGTHEYHAYASAISVCPFVDLTDLGRPARRGRNGVMMHGRANNSSRSRT
jgi:hypothetical protein